MKIVNDMRCHERYIDSEIDGIKQWSVAGFL